METREEAVRCIAKAREQIDEIDRLILTLIALRTYTALGIGVRKRAIGAPMRDREREEAILRRVAEEAGRNGLLSSEDVMCIFREIMRATRASQERWTEADGAVRREQKGRR